MHSPSTELQRKGCKNIFYDILFKALEKKHVKTKRKNGNFPLECIFFLNFPALEEDTVQIPNSDSATHPVQKIKGFTITL